MKRAEAYLNRYKILKERHKNILSEKEEILIDEALPSGIDYSSIRVQTSKNYDGLYNIHQRIEQRTKEKDRVLCQIYEEMCSIRDMIYNIRDPKSMTLLFQRYVMLKDWEQVADRLNVSVDYARKNLKKKALKQFAELLDQEL